MKCQDVSNLFSDGLAKSVYSKREKAEVEKY